MENSFDKIMKDSFEKASTSPPKDLWSRIEGKLDAFEKPVESTHVISLSPVWKYAAAAVVSGVAVALGFLFLNKSSFEENLATRQSNTPVKTNIEIGEQIVPNVNVVNVVEVKQTKQKPSAKPVQTQSSDKFQIADTAPLIDSELVADGNESTNIPVFALKLNKPRTSSLNDKIKVISGEPVRVEVDEDLNKKQILIYQRLRLLNTPKTTLQSQQ